MLTRKQHELLTFIHERLEDTGISPSFEEMKEALNLKSKSGIHRLITALEERGYIRRLPHRARALEVLRVPGQDDAKPARKSAAKGPNVIAPDFSAKDTPAADNDGTVTLPLHGRIANLPAHKVSGVRQAIEAAGASLLYLPPYSPDFNPIEMAFAKLKSLLRKAAKRNINDLWNAIADAIRAFTPNECINYFVAAGYDLD